MKYTINGHEPVPCEDMETWGLWYGTADRCVAHDTIEREDADPVVVSTVFLGIDHNHGFTNGPVLFESLVFGGPLNGEMYRYCTWHDAELGHKHLLAESVTEGELAAWTLKMALNKITA